MSNSWPHLWVFAGPNGAGKSTLIRKIKIAERMPVVNADDIAEGLRRDHGDWGEAAIITHAGRQAIDQRNRCLDEGRSFAIETTLTGHSNLRLLCAARERGYKVNLIYVRIAGAELSNSRVTTRVAAGGHDVPEADVLRRYTRSVGQLLAAIVASDRVCIFDNSGKCYKLVTKTPA